MIKTPIFRAVALIAALTACTPKDAPPDPRDLLTAAQIRASSQPLLLSRIDGIGGGTMIVAGRRDGIVTWRTADFVNFSYRDGLLTATRGLGDDVMSADVSGTHAALTGGPVQDYPRFASYLGADDETRFRAFRCVMRNAGPEAVTSFGTVFPATLMQETCYSPGLQIDNRYWLAPGGGIRRSLQWVSPDVGYLETEQLSRTIIQ
ncbi:YjbF family lipoprotein [Loktanella sp. R86503]|uniref:YjbF family lipoprotein n=1 Tax=Loktanella sp. R86503 TaxID=3093847 RepID=UPI0036D973A2